MANYRESVTYRKAQKYRGVVGQVIFPSGWVASAEGEPSIIASQLLRPAGLSAGAFGTPGPVYNASIRPTGVSLGAYGKPTLVNVDQDVKPTGLNAFGGFGTSWVSLGTRRISTVTLGDQSKFGTAVLAGGVRWIDLAGRGISAAAYGTGIVWFRVREMFPLWFVATGYGKPQVDFNHFVAPAGFGGEAIGQAEVYRPRFIADLAGLGIGPTQWGSARVDLHIQMVKPLGWIDGGATESERFGRAEAFNLLQFVTQLFSVGPDDGGAFGTFNYVDNRNKTIHPDPIQPGRVGQAEIYNNARIISQPADSDFTLWGDTLVAPAIRELLAQGTDTSAWGSPLGNIVYNAARMLAPAGIASGAAGTPERVWSNQQTLKQVGGDQAVHGLPMVAFAVRELGVYGIPGDLPLGNTSVQLWERPLAPKGINPTGLGVPTLEIHWTIIAAKSVLPPANAIGDARVHNVTPEIPIYGWTATLWGTAAVFNQHETYTFEGWDNVEFGRHSVRDRRKTVVPPGINSFVLLNKHQVRKVLPDPPAPQAISPGGLAPPGVPVPVVRSNQIAPTGLSTFGSGSPLVVSNGILPRGITPPFDDSGTQFGIPAFNVTPQLFVSGIPAGDAGGTLPDVGPRYIWAPRGYPYATGYWREQGELMDNAVHQGDQNRPVFGDVTVTHRNRTLTTFGGAFGGIGQPSLGLNPQYVRPVGTAFQKFGFPVLNGGGAVETYGFVMSLLGSPYLTQPDYRPKSIKPSGIAAGAFGATNVQNLHRQLLVKGWDSFTISAPQSPSWPRTSHWVSRAYAPFPAAGSDSARYGTPWVSLYRRYLEPSGWTSESMGSTPGSFRDRMRVRKQMWVRPSGIAPQSAGIANIEFGLHVVGVPGFVEWSVPAPLMRRQYRLNVDGFDALQVGDVQRWEAGTVKPHGDDLSAMGRAVLNRVMHPEGIAGATGMPRLALRVEPVGIEAAAPGDPPVAVARWCGNKAVAVAGYDALIMGTEVAVHEA